MNEVIGVRLSGSGSIAYVDPSGATIQKDVCVIVRTERGLEFATTQFGNLSLPDELVQGEVLELVRVADAADERLVAENARLAQDAFDLCAVKVEEHRLDMKLVDCEYTFDRDKLIFYFTADDRVDFRNLVRDLAQTFHTRIELRQIGVRDQAKRIGGLGPCGQPICCRRYMSDFVPVSIKMAKTQGLSLNPTKISGVCGRLMCCLNYEQDHYLENTKKVPAKGTLVLTEEGQGHVVDRDVLRTRVRVHVYKADGTEDEKYFEVSEIEVLQRRRKGQQRPALRTEDELSAHEFVTEGEKARTNGARTFEEGAEASTCACPKKDVKRTAKVVATAGPDEKVGAATEASSVLSSTSLTAEAAQSGTVMSPSTESSPSAASESASPASEEAQKESYAQKGRVSGTRRRRGRHPRKR